MRIAIDARELSGKPTGVGRYITGLLREWTRPEQRHGHEFLLYSHRSVESSAGCSVRELSGTGGTFGNNGRCRPPSPPMRSTCSSRRPTRRRCSLRSLEW